MKKLFFTLPLALLVACSSVDVENNNGLELNILHINDHHSHLEPETVKMKLNGISTDVKVGGFPEILNEINEKKKVVKNPLVLHAGDAITGTLYFTLFGGSADAEMMNMVGFDYFTLGNHEFDAGNEGLKKFLDFLKVPVLSSNVVPQSGSILENYWKPYDIKDFNGQKVGIIGLDVVKKTKESSSPGKDIVFTDEVETAQKYADILKEQGVNKIVLLSHGGAEKNFEIAQKVSGIDVIITGDTHYLFGDEALKDFGLQVKSEYPTKFTSPAGEPVYVVEGWEYSKFLGHLKVQFDKDGLVTSIEGHPVIPFHKDSKFTRKDKDGKKYSPEGTEREEIINTLKAHHYFKEAVADAKAAETLEKYKEEKQKLGGQIVGVLTGAPMPGGSANRIPNTANPKGSVATRFVAETMLEQMKHAGKALDLTIQNSGGVRADIQPGEISFNDAYTILPFGNTLFILEMTGAEVKQVIEDALQYALVEGSTGAFPYGAGVRYEATQYPNKNGERVTKIEVQNSKTGAWEKVDPAKTYRVGTNAYIASGKDGYTTFGKVSKERGGEDTYLPDAESLIQFMKKHPKMENYTDSNVKFKFDPKNEIKK